MSVEDVVAAAMHLPREDRLSLLEQVEDSLYPDETDPTGSHRIIEQIEADQMRTVPAGQMGDDSDRVTVPALEAAALQIPEGERAELIDRLIESLTGTSGYDPAWLAELDRRINEVQAGTAKTIPAEAVFAKMRERRDARSLP